MKTQTLLKIKQAISSTHLMLMAHPDNEENSEFEDRISDLEESLELIEAELPKGDLTRQDNFEGKGLSQ